jgi:hypothetical protein
MIRKIVLVFLLCLSGCGSLKDYDVTLNDRVVYTPRPLAVDAAITDPALAACIAQTLKDQNLSSPTQLQALICTSAGITSLQGIEIYSAIARLKLSGNKLTDVTALQPLAALDDLWLDDNALVDVSVLEALTGLSRLNLAGNPALDCISARTLPIRALTLPEHCES